MSKITAKNLSYDTSLPPFLARLKSQDPSSNGGRAEYVAPRPKKLRDPDADADDEPVYFDEESGETLSKREWEERETADEEKAAAGETAAAEAGGVEKALEEVSGREIREVKEKLAGIGGSKKRKAGKIVGGGEGGDDGDGDEKDEDTSVAKALKVDQKNVSSAKPDDKKVDKGVKATKKGKKKKIMLSFGDDE